MIVLYYFFFFKQKTAYEMRISDWSSDVCSSDLKTPGKTANKSRMLRVGIVQQPCTDDRDYNLKMSEDGIRAAAAGGAQLVLLQELHTSLYFCQHEATELFDLAETIPGPSTDFLAALAKELGVVIVGSLFERRAPGLYHNTAVVLESDGTIAGKYRKMHIPDADRKSTRLNSSH